MKKLPALIILSGLIFPLFAYADACTYGEAIMAFKQGNTTRGVALMNMAAKDGDQRAEKYLANIQNSNQTSVIKLDSQMAFFEK